MKMQELHTIANRNLIVNQNNRLQRMLKLNKSVKTTINVLIFNFCNLFYYYAIDFDSQILMSSIL